MFTFKKQLTFLKIFLFGCIILTCFQACDDEPVDPIIIVDTDDDGIPNATDNCPNEFNPNQEDSNDNGIGDACEEITENDLDNDGILDDIDNCPLTPNPGQEDSDNDGIGDVCDDTPFVTPLYACENGMAGPYSCNNYDLMGYISIEELAETGAEGNDSWGWTDPTTNKEYALVCSTQGTAFVDISDPTAPILLGKLASANPGNSGNVWRDVKTYNNYAFIVSEASGHGMQVFDLTRLRDVANAPETFTSDAHFTGFGAAHNIVINETSGYAYIVGSNVNSGGPLFINIQNPTNPINEGSFPGYSHDAQVVTYNGPDPDYAGQEILIGSNGSELVIADVTDKSNPTPISTVTYNNIGYVHQGWFTENMEYFILGDETDELGFGNNTRTIVFDFADLDNPTLHMNYNGPTAAIDHNGYVKGNDYYLSNYSAGLRIIDISNISSNSMEEIGYFDTYPENNNTSFKGAWNVYPYFASGNIIVSDINRGLFIVRKSGT
ncbi:choice-of-anchor B family protein [Formosa maritima]|uniref:Choice-of-anchor B family protein n=1 Tax=Formosa maritima TaxID=2592046 RepID=A0A5D0GMG5_9FLAO|nr:choice-of-anchor B family protein [Formosa maritima]TYA60083.1 choice-of-anchor B family protein [Formosa maritima]